MPTRIGGTRWLGHVQTALNSLWKGYPAFVTHLGQVSLHNTQSATQSKAKYLLKLLRRKSVIVFAHFINDVVNVLTKLSMCLQQRATCLYEVHQDLECTIANIQTLEARPGQELRKVREIISNDGKFEGELLVGNDDFEGQTVKVLKALVESLQKRFKDITEGVKQATKIADLASWPATIDNEPEFGDEMVSNLVDHYRQLLDQTDGVDVKGFEKSTKLLIPSLFMIHAMIYNLSILVYKQFLPDMKSTSMTLLMTIQLHSDPITQFNPEQVIHQWNKGARRRPNFMQKKVKKTVVQQMEEIMNVNEDETQELTNSVDNVETAAACPDKAADSCYVLLMIMFNLCVCAESVSETRKQNEDKEEENIHRKYQEVLKAADEDMGISIVAGSKTTDEEQYRQIVKEAYEDPCIPLTTHEMFIMYLEHCILFILVCWNILNLFDDLKYVKDFSKIAKPLFDLTKKNQKFAWNKDAEAAFLGLKSRLISAPILGFPQADGSEVILDTDASAYAIGAVLSQIQDGKERVMRTVVGA
ncbi:unnamed protein product [Mytilus coruscus]|uniref:Reverse transcriptase/retrotransposon-derived protein RNase H-like domain-containing protein n=1 Tax=Mytilus coruscus TaxID=42192 RepID=A0A6J8A8J3_MYTCO|nr:unnamed protein product [Mytilus coruscus]